MIKQLSPPLLFRILAPAAVCLLVGRLVFSTASASIQADDYSVSWYTFDGGGDVSTGEPYTVMGTIGQPDAGQHDDGIVIRPDRRFLGLGGALPGLPAADQKALIGLLNQYRSLEVQAPVFIDFISHTCNSEHLMLLYKYNSTSIAA